MMAKRKLMKTIPGFSRYRLDADGHLWNVWDSRRLFGAMSGPEGKRYPQVALIPDTGDLGHNRRPRFYIHVLVCEAFHGPRPSPEHEVRHLDGSVTNHHPSNLCWGTKVENAADCKRHGKRTGPNGKTSGMDDQTREWVKEAARDGDMTHTEIANVVGIHPTNITHFLNGKRYRPLVQP